MNSTDPSKLSSSINKAPAAIMTMLKVWHRIECWVAVLCFVFIASVLILDVVYRELYGPLMDWLELSKGSGGFFGAQKLAIFALVIGSFAGIGIATATGSHLVPQIAFSWFPPRWNSIINRIADILTGVVFLITAWYGLQFALTTKEFGILAPVINMSPWIVQLIIPLGFISAGLRYFIFAIWQSARPQLPEFS